MKNTRNKKTNKISATSKVFNQLRRDIVTGKISGGTRLVETDLAHKMKVSRTPVREALQKLVQEGLLDFIPRVGYFVEDISDYDVQDLFAVRTALEKLAVKWAVEKITDEEIGMLEKNIKKTDDILNSGPHKDLPEKTVELDREFHQTIYLASRSKRLAHMCMMLNDHSVKFRLVMQDKPEIVQRMKEGHLKLLNALRTRDPKQVEEKMQSHIDIGKKSVMDNLERLRFESLKAESIAI